jgi:hypothetical protein
VDIVDVAPTNREFGEVGYGNTGCGVFKDKISFWLKINCSQMKSLNFAKSDFQSHPNLSDFFFIE